MWRLITHIFISLHIVSGSMASTVNDTSTLKRLITLSRHGDRAPNYIVQSTCPGNAKNLASYHVPMQELTEFGMAQLVAVGKHIRDQYGENSTEKFLSTSLNGATNKHFESYFRADAATRCSQSATSAGYGLYPDGTGPSGFAQQPIPITMQLLKNEHDFAAPKGPCLEVLNADMEVYAATRGQELISEYSKDLAMLSEACKFPVKDIPTMKGGEDLIIGIKDLADMLTFDEAEGLPLLPGLTPNVSARIKQLAFSNLIEEYYSTPRTITYWVGGFPKLLLGNLNLAASPEYPVTTDYRYFAYHGHRELLHGLGKLLGWDFHFKGLPFAKGTSALHPGTTMTFELRESLSTQEYFVRTYVWSPMTTREQVKLSKCSVLDCPLDEFNMIITNHTALTGTWETICNYIGPEENVNPSLRAKIEGKSDLGFTYFSNLSAFLVAVILAAILFFIYTTRLRHRQAYVALNQ